MTYLAGLFRKSFRNAQKQDAEQRLMDEMSRWEELSLQLEE